MNSGNAALAVSTPESRLSAAWTLLVRIALTALGIYLFWRIREILTTVLISLVLACAAGALVDPLCHYRLPFLRPKTQRTIATSIVFILLALALVGSVRLLINPFQQEYANLQEHWTSYRAILIEQIGKAKDLYAGLPPQWQTFLQHQMSQQSLPSPTGWIVGALGTTVSWAAHIVELILIPVLAFYFTLDARSLRNEALLLVPRAHLRPTIAILDEGGAILRNYVVAQFWLAVIAGVVVGVGLKLLGMDYALILGIFAGVTRAIPVIGPLIGGIPVVALSFVYGAQQGNPILWIEVLSFFTALHLIESKVVMPKFLGHRLHLHAAIILITLLIGGEFFGLIGMFMAVPVAALARVLLMHYVVLPRRRAEAEARQSSKEAGAPPGPPAASSSSGRILRLERAIRNVTSSPIPANVGTVATAKSVPPKSPTD